VKLEAAKVRSGDYVHNAAGDRIKVLASYAGLGADSSSSTKWFLEGYAPDKPTTRLILDPNARIEVERP
jgi:hypothetical protein